MTKKNITIKPSSIQWTLVLLIEKFPSLTVSGKSRSEWYLAAAGLLATMSANTVAPISTNPLAVSHLRNSWSGWTSFLIADGLALVIIASHDYDHICLKDKDRSRERRLINQRSCSSRERRL